MGTYSELVVVKGDVRGYESALASASAKTKSAAASWVSTLQRAGTSLTKFGKSATKWVTLPLLAAGVAAIKFAADAEETANKVVIAFGDQADAILDWSKTTIDKLGLASQTSQDMASSFGLLFSAAGITGTALVDLSKKFAILTADISSAFNVPFEEALMALRSGLVGETEPLRRFSIFLSEAALQQQALKMGLIETGGELTEQQKVMARSAFIMESLTERGVAGDMERTLGSTANQIRATVERLKEMAAEIGADLLPVAQDFLGVAKGFIGFLTGMSEGARQNVIRLAALALILGPVARLLGAAAKAAAGLATALAAVNAAGVSGAVLRLAAWLAGIGTAAPTAAVGALYFATSVDTASQSVSKFAGIAEGYTEEQVKADLATAKVGDTIAGLDQTVRDAIPGTEALRGTLAGLGNTVADVTENMGELEQSHDEAAEALTRFANLTKKEFQDWKEGTTSSMNFVEGALQSLAGEAKVTAEEIREAFQKALVAQANFKDNAVRFLREVQDRFPKLSGAAQEMVADLAEMGPEGAAILAALAGATERQQQRILEAWNRSQTGAERFAGAVRAAARDLAGLPEQKTVHLTFVEHRIAAGRMHRGGQVAGRARTDVPILAQEGEFVINRESARRLGPGTLAMLNRYHAGGLVTPAGGATPAFDPRVLAEAISVALQKIPADGRPSGRELVIVPVAWAEDVEARVSAIRGTRAAHRAAL